MNEIGTGYYPIDLDGRQRNHSGSSEKMSPSTKPIIGTENAVNADKTARDLKIDFNNIYAQKYFGFMGFNDPLTVATFEKGVISKNSYVYQYIISPKKPENTSKNLNKGFGNIDFINPYTPRSFGFITFDDPLSQRLLHQ